jgi:LacI family transcriptional regulator
MVGFDDFELADLLGITVIAQDTAELGRRAAQLLFQRLDGDRSPRHRVVIPTRMISRGSGELRSAEGRPARAVRDSGKVHAIWP